MKKFRWMIIYYLCLIAFTVYITMDTFVISRAWNADTSQMNTSMFNDVNNSDQSEDDSTDSDKDSNSDNGDGDTFEKKRSDKSRFESSDGSHPEWPGPGRGKDGSSGRSEDRESGSGSNTESTSTSSGTVTLEEDSSKAQNWKDKNMKISLKQYRANNTTVYVADVVLSSAEYLKTAFANKTYGKNVTQTASEMADASNAILAINGDNYGSQEKGCVIRNGIVYRETGGNSDLLCIYADGSMKVISQSEASADELVNQGVWQAFSFGPGLMKNGEITVTKDQEVGIARASNPRTAIGCVDKLHYLFVVSDGRTEESEGLSLHELADLMKQLGAKTAYNLDGGGSSTMVFDGKVINQPTSTGRTIEQRKVNDIVYLG